MCVQYTSIIILNLSYTCNASKIKMRVCAVYSLVLKYSPYIVSYI